MIDYQSVPSPCYVIDEDRLRSNLELIRSVAQASGAEIILAFKGFAMWSVFPIVKEYVSGAAASSIHEARLSFEEMGTPAHSFAPAYSSEEFGMILRYSSHVTFNSLAQYEKFAPVLKKEGKHISPGLRINPEYSHISQGLYNPCSPGSRLGVTSAELGDNLPDGVEGLHFHVLFESDSFALEKVLKVIETKFGHLLPRLKWLNMGGGHLMTRKGYDKEHMINLLRSFREKYGIHIILEPGSAFAWETGELVATVEDIVIRDGISTAILNVSFTAHMPDCLEMPYKPVIVGAFEPVKGKPTYRMGGNSCLSGDYMGDWSFHRELQTGDRIIFWDMIQ